MKMMNNDIEFIAFDAQDVIATSGPLTGVSKVRFLGSYVNSYNSTYGGFDFADTNKAYKNSASKYFAYDLADMPADSAGNLWNADSVASNKSNSDKNQADYTLLESVADIVSWLEDNGYKAHQ